MMFTVLPDAPAAPTLELILGGTDNRPTFQWDPVGGATRYYLELRNLTTNRLLRHLSLSTSVCSTGTCSYALPFTLMNGNYLWRVRSYNIAGWSAFSETNFSVP